MVVFYVSGHGFGHATRCLTVIDRLHHLVPALRIAIRSSVPRWFIERSTRTPVDITPVDTDTGMVQIDSLRLDEDESARRAAAFYASLDARVSQEARALDALGATVVVGDIPPLAFAAAARAGVPSVACANFTWDWIYSAYAQFDAAAPDVIPRIGAAYATADLALRLPFHGGFETMAAVTRDVPLIARRSRRGREEARAALQISDGRPVVLVSFGGHGTRLPLEAIAERGDLTLLMTGHEASGIDRDMPSLRVLDETLLEALDLRYEDLVAAADVVISKPGYGIISECLANQTPLLYTSRGNFIEQDVLVAGMSPLLKTAFISNEDLRAGRWEVAVARLLEQPAPHTRIEVNGAEVVAEAILQLRRL